MASIIWLAGFLTVALGCLTVWQPKLLAKILNWIQKDVFFYTTALLKAAFGVVMLVWSRSCNRPGVIIALGVIVLAGSIAAIIAPRTHTRNILSFFLRRPLWFFRIWGLLSIAVGVLVVWAGWPV